MRAVFVSVAMLIFWPLRLTAFELAELARLKNDDPGHLMTAYGVTEATGLTVEQVVRDLRRDGVPRANAVGLRQWLHLSMTSVRYRRDDIERWRDRLPQESSAATD